MFRELENLKFVRTIRGLFESKKAPRVNNIEGYVYQLDPSNRDNKLVNSYIVPEARKTLNQGIL